jgi:hypothetical protein
MFCVTVVFFNSNDTSPNQLTRSVPCQHAREARRLPLQGGQTCWKVEEMLRGSSDPFSQVLSIRQAGGETQDAYRLILLVLVADLPHPRCNHLQEEEEITSFQPQAD